MDDRTIRHSILQSASRLARVMAPMLLAGLLGWPAHALAADKQRLLDRLLAQMSVAEKIGQLRMLYAGAEPAPQAALQTVAEAGAGAMFTAPGVTRAQLRQFQDAAVRQSRLGIPLFFAGDVVHGQRTVFPIGLGLASSWDLRAIGRSARIAAMEASADGLDMTFAPVADISRDPRWGRISEGYGEDPYLASRIVETVVRQLQGPRLGTADSLMACVKHFAAYGAVEGGRDYNTVDMSRQRLFQDYMPPYQAAVEAGAGALMSALTTLNGVPATADRWLLHEVLREQWRYDGLVVSDHGAVEELLAHGVAASASEAARMALEAGTQMSMSDRFFEQALGRLVEQDQVPVSLLDQAVRQVLSTKYDLGLFEDPYRRLGQAQDDPADAQAESRLHRAQARDVARRSLVLLKNRDQVLPLQRHGSIAVIGPLADNPVDILGSWPGSGQSRQAVSLYEGIRRSVAGQAKVLHALGSNIVDRPHVFDRLADNQARFDPRSPATLLAEAVAVANQADVVVAALGEARGMSHEGASKTDLNLPDQQRELLLALQRTGKPLVLVLMNGRPLTIVEESQQADAVLETWFSGTEGGNAIADVLFGDYNPSGKLPVSFPRSVGQVPLFYNRLNTGRPVDPQGRGAYQSHYFDIDDGPLYPFGHGPSYTRFSLSAPTLSAHQLQPGGSLHASVRVRNEGQRSGETVVQLYIRDRSASVSRPLKELKGFQKVALAPGETREISFAIDESMLALLDRDLRWTVEPGGFEVMIGLDSEHVQRTHFELTRMPR